MGLKFSKEDVIEEVRVQELPASEDKDEIYAVLTDEPQNAEANLNYAIFLVHVEKRVEEAEQYFNYAMQCDKYSAKCIGFYALYLEITRKEIERAGELYKKCYEDIILEKDEVNFVCNYAVYQKNCLNDPKKADELYKKMIAANPTHAIAHEYDRAEDHFQKAINLDPNVAHWQLAYGNFLKFQKKDVKGSQQYFSRAKDLKKVDRQKEKESVKKERLRLKQEKKELVQKAKEEREQKVKEEKDAKIRALKEEKDAKLKRSSSSTPRGVSSAPSTPIERTASVGSHRSSVDFKLGTEKSMSTNSISSNVTTTSFKSHDSQ